MENNLKRIIVETLKSEGALKISVFGSYARNEQQQHSDIDLLVEFKKPISLLTHARIKRELAEKTGKNIDLLTPKSLSMHIKPYIQKDIISLEP